MIAGVYGATGVLTALRVAERDGRGQVVDLSLFEPIFSVIASEAAKCRINGVPTMRAGNQSTHTAPRNVYVCRDGQFVALSGSMQSMAMKIFDTIGRPELKTDPRFATNDARVAHRDELDALIGAFMGERSAGRGAGVVRGGRRHRRPGVLGGRSARSSVRDRARGDRRDGGRAARQPADAQRDPAPVGHAGRAAAAGAGAGRAHRRDPGRTGAAAMTAEPARALPRALPVWRSILFVPALSERFVDSALRQPADALQIDLEDSIGPDDKQRAREAAPAGCTALCRRPAST
ncbi:MAG: aldolase/citrate lyase family protein [Comamonadaceae bacterium]|nr:aldolase/citrate lyase family protein [Comamonadaceae bacterium]